MARPPRVDVGGYCYHVLNRANARYRMFRTDADFAAFERVLAEALVRHEGRVQLLAYCLMGNHWHLVLQTAAPPKGDGELGRFMKWLTTTHAGRYRVAHGQGGIGHLYQGRYKSFLIDDEGHFLRVCRYVERNAARASLPTPGSRAEDWAWSSLYRWRNADVGREVGEGEEEAARPMTVVARTSEASGIGVEGADLPGAGVGLMLSPWPLPKGVAARIGRGSGCGRSTRH